MALVQEIHIQQLFVLEHDRTVRHFATFFVLFWFLVQLTVKMNYFTIQREEFFLILI